jgi:hypothetical protein
MKAGKLDEACEKFAGSMKADPSVGALVNLARCHEKQGKTASAYAEYQRAAELAVNERQPARGRAARQLAVALKPKLSRLTVTLAEPGADVTVTRNGEEIDQLDFGKAVPVDPGEHAIEARAAGHQTWSTTVQVGPDADQQSVEVPALEPAPDQPGGAAGLGEATEPGLDEGADEGEFTWTGQHIAAVVTAGVGVAGVVLGIVFGTQASSKWDEALSYCNNEDINDCSAEAGPLSQDANTFATVSTVGLVVGGAAIAAAVIVWLTAPSGADEEPETEVGWQLAPMVGRDTAGGALRGRF